MKIHPIIYILFCILVLSILFFIFNSRNLIKENPITQPQVNVQPSINKEFNLVVKNRKLVSGSDIIRVSEGDQVSIHIITDESDELHLHGYDKSVELEKDVAATLQFKADITGRFTYELEQSKTEIGAVEVLPK